MAIYDPTKRPTDAYDTHTHLNDEKLWIDPEAYWARAREYRVMEMNVVGYNKLGNERAIELAKKLEGVHATVGWQTEDLVNFNSQEMAILEEQLADPNVVGIGETGLDYYWPENPGHEVQKGALKNQLYLANSMHKPVTIHSRDAFDDTYDILSNSNVKDFGGVMHSFTGGPEEAKRFLDLGMYISFSGIVTFNNAQDIKDAAKVVPLDRILVETDAPFLAPVPMRGKTNEPMFVKYVLENLAEQLDMPYNDLAKVTTENAHRLWKTNNEN
ncbi:TatD family hydrolase [Weissella koreensis]|uniref:TatD family deoxyribonuclease n=1 Tax=Weissella koreensis TaxID=165096 RepID=A0A7H1MLZ6_9LACO|nr:TatD family hydrolase [Weissella koreensis]AEJ23656.1 Mg-dependent DNase [Weissella koreensis KACC 15510]AVH75280.1 TatD family deoxyribonuclease [Weissella koreensis]EJF33314.1 TatD family deoxyribonuclease [Weissella koreensis KCTC 3621]MCZ9311124.1 TatD family hydrolase [Weissella koreensis]QGN20504.1 YchF/TatD family DNA exonuclease [Weissella koreensis]